MTDDRNDPASAELTPAERELDELVTRLAQSYHRPPDIVPADQMWARIQERRTVAGSAHPAHRHPGWWVLAASAAFLAIGISIGRGWRPTTASRTPTTVVASTAPTPNDASRRNGPPPALTPSDSGAIGVGQHPSGAALAEAPREDGRRTVRNPARTVPTPGAVQSDAGGSANTAYQLATVKHFTEVEALLTSFESSRHDARMDAQMAAWGRDLLGQTRLLLDSPAAADPARRKLLQDLELVLVQITQLSPSTAPVERDLIDGAVRTSDVMPRLRTAVPAGGATHFNGA